uniref:Misato mitochondrial distribution and morphology regulator 1 n=1 Tax=Otus sunia TaxID=257818 RepID=A0A8C8BDR7_9STRI
CGAAAAAAARGRRQLPPVCVAGTGRWRLTGRRAERDAAAPGPAGAPETPLGCKKLVLFSLFFIQGDVQSGTVFALLTPLVPGAAPAPRAGSQLWSDYLSVRLHPKSIYVVRQYMHDGECGCLEAFGQGERLLQDPSCLEELEDRLHFYVEECDYLQGFQVLCDLHDGFSGVGAKVTELLCDEYSGKGILTWGLTPVLSNVGDSQKNFYRLMNTALGIVHLSSHSSLFCPLSLSGSLGIKPQPPLTFPYINYDASLHYHSSAILAAVLDTLTAPYRLRSSQGSMMHLAETLNFSGRKVVAAWAAVPFPALRGYSLPDTLCAYQQDVPWKLLSSCREQKVSCCFAQSVVLRGELKAEQVLGNFIHFLPYSTSHVLEQPCNTLPPYPQFFSPLLTRQAEPSAVPAAVESVPVLAALRSSPALRALLRPLERDLRRRRRWGSFCAAGVEHDDFQEALEELRTLAQSAITGCMKQPHQFSEPVGHLKNKGNPR